MLDRPFEIFSVEHGAATPLSIHLEGSIPAHILKSVAPIRVSYHGRNHYNSLVPAAGAAKWKGLGERHSSEIVMSRKAKNAK